MNQSRERESVTKPKSLVFEVQRRIPIQNEHGVIKANPTARHLLGLLTVPKSVKTSLSYTILDNR